MKNKIAIAVSVIAISSMALTQTACSSRKAGDNQSVKIDLHFGSYSVAGSNFIWDLLMPKAYAQVSSLKMCFKRLRFKTAEDLDSSSSSSSSSTAKAGADDPANHNLADDNGVDPNDADEDNVDFHIGEVTVSSSNTSLGTIEIPPGDYRRIEFDLDSNCASGKSVQLSNDQGVYSTADRITIKFDGNFNASQDGILTLEVQAILDALNAYNGTTTLKSTLEGVSGSL